MHTYSYRVGVWKDLDQGPGLTCISNDLPRWTSARRAPSVRPLQCSRASLKRFALLTLVALWPTSVRLLPSFSPGGFMVWLVKGSFQEN